MVRSVKALFRGSSAPAVAAFVATALAGTAQAATLAIGPIEQVNLKNSTIVVLGQTYQVGPEAVLKTQAGTPTTLNTLAPNTLVEIDGTESARGQSAVSRVTSLPEMDVPGATQLLVTGVVASETATGQIKVGNLVVDVTATLTSDAQKFAVGGLVQVAGTQPNPGGMFLAQNVTSIGNLQAPGVQGTSLSTTTALGVEGTGHSSTTALGVEGTGHSSVTALGVEGTGHSSTTALGVEGTGLSATTALGVEGTGKAQVALGVEGTGHSSTTALGVEGTGLSATTALGVEGTGRKQ
jgi:hypothetical protein